MATTVWRGHLAFGLVSFPIRLYRAARAEKISFRRLYRPAPEPPRIAIAPEPEPEREAEPEPPPPPRGHGRRAAAPQAQAPAPGPERQPEPEPVFRTRNEVVSATGGEPVGRGNVVHGYEYEKGRYVVLDDEDIRGITPQTSKEMQVLEFVRLAEIDPIYFETSYYVAPDEPGERPYALLFEALRETGFVGLAQLAMHRREHVVVVRPGRSGLIAHTMYYPDEIRSTGEFRADPSQINPRELELAKKLIGTLAAPFEPEKFRDTFRDRLRQMIEARIQGRQVAQERGVTRRTAEVVDIMQALEKSLNAARKPAAPAPAQERKGRTKRAG
jgi:DNA end-binding protein Ku